MIADIVRSCFPVAAKVVADKADEINKLNVFPVPDGDTGTKALFLPGPYPCLQ